jgi:hypothetical protein
VIKTHSVQNCHGWNLGEYLALGKAIVSTPLSSNLPEKLVHGKNIHFISNISELKVAIIFLLDNIGCRTIFGIRHQRELFEICLSTKGC